ncbi:metallophosphoesterase, partial [Salinimicrobium oceani]
MRILKGIFLAGIAIYSFTACNRLTGANAGSAVTAKDTLSITVLQTADIHGQLDPHPELFWENGEIVFKERGGLANIKTLFKEERGKNPGRTIIVDGGDLIQGSGYAALSEGRIFPELISNMGYDVIIPGNWEVVYGKDRMMDIMTHYNTPVIAQNMFHQDNGKPLFPPYWIKEIEGVKIGFIGI